MDLKIGKKAISKDSPTYIVAELSANHNQDYELTVDLIRAAKEAGANAIKVQTYTPESMTLDSELDIFQTRKDSLWAGRKLFDLYKESAMPYNWQPKLKEVATKAGLDFFSTPFDLKAVDFLEEMNVPAYKIASLEITDIPLIKYAASKGKPMIISTGIASLEDIELAVNTCRNEGNNSIALLKCTSAYPTSLEEMNLNNLITLEKKFNAIVGLSDHSLSNTPPVIAVALGARIIEKHFILDRAIGGPDAAFSLNKSEFAGMVKMIREAEMALGNEKYTVTPKMKKARISARSLIVVQNIKAGEAFTTENIKVLRPGYGMHPKHYQNILRLKAKVDLKPGTPLNFNLTD